MTTYQLIQQPEQLDAVLQMMQHTDICFLDTEFIRRKTRHAELALIQINLSGQVFLLDVVSLTEQISLKPFWQALLNIPCLVLHSCHEDVGIIKHQMSQYELECCLNNVFDTQVALEFLGFGQNGQTVGYQSALAECLSIHIDKNQRCSDWLARPLSVEQLQYASDDVYYLPQLFAYVEQQLQQRGLFSYVQEECRDLIQEMLRDIPIQQLYLEYARPKYSSRQLAQLQQLLEWRENCSISQNIPPSFVIKTHDIIMLVQCQPKNEQDIIKLLPQAPKNKRYLNTLLKLLYKLPPIKDYPPRLPDVPQPNTHTQHAIDQLITLTAKQLQMPSNCLMRKKWLAHLYMVRAFPQKIHTLPDFLLGWRYDIITQPILQRLDDDMGLKTYSSFSVQS